MNKPSIIRLDDKVVSLIAAGEVIQRPYNAVKELIENSLDAGAKTITIVMNGMDYIQIQDDGCGIHKADLELICQRHTTSKIKAYEDLQHLQSFGFRGEALASLCQVSNLTIVTKQNNDLFAYRASFFDSSGILHDAPEPCAGNVGTVITVEDLFHCLPARRHMFNMTEEFQSILDLIARFALHFNTVSFMARKKSGRQFEFRTTGSDSQTDLILNLFLSNRKSCLIPIELNEEHYSLKGYVSGIYSSLKTYGCIFILFVNNRLVDCPPLRRIVRPHCSFIYLSVNTLPELLDVNVHPAKQEVRFLYQDTLIKSVLNLIEKVTTNQEFPSTTTTQISFQSSTQKSSQSSSSKELNRSDEKEQKLDAYLQLKSPCRRLTPDLKKRKCELISIKELIQELTTMTNEQSQTVLREMIFVGVVDESRILMQHKNALLLGNLSLLTQQLFYELALMNFGNYGEYRFRESVSIKRLASIGLKDPLLSDCENQNAIIENVVTILCKKAVMLHDYFSIEIDEKNGHIKSLPVLLSNYVPCFTGLPYFILRLATEVNWKEEKVCLKQICHEISVFYSMKNFSKKYDRTFINNLIENVLIPKIKADFHPISPPSDYFIHMVELSDLYKVFERC